MAKKGLTNVKYKLPGDLSYHKRMVHENIKPHKCDKCKKCFGQNTTLKTHSLTVHENEKPFECEICQRCFGGKGSLKKHQTIVCHLGMVWMSIGYHLSHFRVKTRTCVCASFGSGYKFVSSWASLWPLNSHHFETC